MHGWGLDQSKRWALQLQVLALKQGTREVWVLGSVILIKYSEARIGQEQALCSSHARLSPLPILPVQRASGRGVIWPWSIPPSSFPSGNSYSFDKVLLKYKGFSEFLDNVLYWSYLLLVRAHRFSTSVFFTLLTSWYISPPSLHLSVNHSYLKKMAKDLQFPI